MTVIAKISCPRLQKIYPRERLFQVLDQDIEIPITWISAPAGSGKTTLIASWLNARKLPALWYQVDEGDGDIATFFYYLGLAAKQAAPRYRKPLPLLTPDYLQGISTFTRRYFEELFSRLKAPTVVIFDNYQEAANDSPLHEVIRDGLRVIPTGMKVFLISRADPPAIMVRSKAERRMTTLGWEDLRLTRDETAAIAAIQGNKVFTGEAVNRIQEITQGWTAGVILLTENMPRAGATLSISATDGLADVFNYFAEEILAKTSPDVRDFLVKTSLMPKMTVKMAVQLTGLNRSTEILSHLLRNHYFTQKHSGAEPVYQYHALFSEFLSSRLPHYYGNAEIVALKRQAAVILAEAGEFGDALELLRDSGQWEDFIRLILGQAQSLLFQGRLQILAEWLGSVPREMAENLPWLLYWQGVCQLPYAPSSSRLLFEQAFRTFQSQNDAAGVLLSWSGVADSIFYERDNFTPLDLWIDCFITLTEGDFRFPSPEIEMATVSGITLALQWRRPDHPDLGKWINRAVALSSECLTAPIGIRMQLMLNACWYYFLRGEFANCTLLMEKSACLAENRTAPPLVKIMQKFIEAVVSQMHPATSGQSLQTVEEGLAIAEETGVHVCDHLLYSQGLYTSFSRQDIGKVEDLLRRLTKWDLECTEYTKFLGTNYFYGWYYFIIGDFTRARVLVEMSLNSTVAAGVPFSEMLGRFLLAEILAEIKQIDQARDELKIVAEFSRKTANNHLEYISLLAEAHIELECGNDNGAVLLLDHAFSLGRAHNNKSLFLWSRLAKMVRLCIKALEAGIEVEFVQSLVRELKLTPENAPLHVENWPWPVKIYTLGRFDLIMDGKPLMSSGKAQQRPLAMLKALIALGGRDVSEERLSDLLWPDADGAAARAAFDMTLLRLRRLLDNELAVLMRFGKVTLNPHICWVDVWAFESISGEFETLLRGETAAKNCSELIRLAEKGISLYHGNFLAGDATVPWAISKQERLRGRFQSLVSILGGLHEERGNWCEAVECYRKGLETDELAEEFYRRLMVCHQKLGKRAEALKLYQRCRLSLASILGVIPCAETRAIFKEIEKD